jgi:O-acetyl-ADP-ribose deacetylase (regulator of RNase III)
MKNIEFGNIIKNVSSGVIVHGVNCRGVMGSGIAEEIKREWPECFLKYQAVCSKEVSNPEVLLGQCVFYVVPGSTTRSSLVIANVFTQVNYGRDSRTRYVNYKAIQKGFRTVIKSAGENNLGTVHYPMIGAGLGNGDWSIISEIISTEFNNMHDLYPNLNSTLWIYEE